MPHVLAEALPTWLPYWIAGVLVLVSAMGPFWNGVKALAEMRRALWSKVGHRRIRRLLSRSFLMGVAICGVLLFAYVGLNVRETHGKRRLFWWSVLGYMNLMAIVNSYSYSMQFASYKVDYPWTFEKGVKFGLEAFRPLGLFLYSFCCFWAGIYAALVVE